VSCIAPQLETPLAEPQILQVSATTVPPGDWDAYVEAHADASAYHRASAVRVGADTFGLRVTFLSARDAQGRLTGVLPLVEQSSWLFGRFLASVPFFTYGGVLADGQTAAAALAAHATELARVRRAAHVELRHTAPRELSGYAERLDKVSMVLRLPASEEALSKQLGAKLRSQIRRADREQPQILWGGAELIPDFYDVFAAAMHDLGTPVYPQRFFSVVHAALPGLIHVLVVKVGGVAQAAAILVRHGRRIEVPWAAATPAAKRGAVNMRMYWELLRFSVQAGAEAFDFGRSTVDSGTYRFKAQWGAQPMQLHWHYWLPEGKSIPQLNQANPKYALAASWWRRMPLWCANLLGPHIVRNLP